MFPYVIAAVIASICYAIYFIDQEKRRHTHTETIREPTISYLEKYYEKNFADMAKDHDYYHQLVQAETPSLQEFREISSDGMVINVNSTYVYVLKKKPDGSFYNYSIEGTPRYSSSHHPGIMDEEGNFVSKPFILKYYYDESSIDEVREMLNAPYIPAYYKTNFIKYYYIGVEDTVNYALSKLPHYTTATKEDTRKANDPMGPTIEELKNNHPEIFI
jgi:Tfp pilus assembly protein PilE